MFFSNKKIIGLSLVGVTVIFLVSIIIAPWIAKLLECFYKVPADPNSAALLGSINGAWGSYIGGLIGGLGTLIAVYFSISQTNKIQADYREESIRKEKLNFKDDVISLTAKYITEISAYYYRCIEEGELYNELDKLRAENSDDEKIFQKKMEIRTLNVDRSKANECFFILRMKLSKISSAKKLLNQMDVIHMNASIERLRIKEFSEEIKKLETIATEFADAYVT